MTVDGKPGKYGYEGRISKTRIKLESEHLLLLANFSMLCISLLTQEDVELSNTILTASLPPRQYCVLKMKAAWFHMQTLMRLTVEKASFFVMQCCQELIKVSYRCVNEVMLLDMMLFRLVLPHQSNCKD